MISVQELIQEVAQARASYLALVSVIPEEKAQWKQAPDSWNLTEITEHLFWAEQGGIVGMWKTLHAIRSGTLERRYESIHKDMPIEQIIELTWQPKELVPAVAAPRLGGPLVFWTISLASLQEVLDAFGEELKEDELRVQAHPHPISGDIDFRQRLEFLRFHIERHKGQASQVLEVMNGY